MKQLIRTVFASMLGTLIALVFLFFIVIGSLTALTMSSETVTEVGPIKDQSVLRVEFNGLLKDHLHRNDILSSLLKYDEPPVMGLYELSQVLKEAAKDKKIKGLFLHFKNFKSGMANAEAIRREIIGFKFSGKFVIAYGETYSEISYLVASSADEVILYPKGYFEWDGLFSTMSYLKNTMTKLDVVPQIFRVGKYKSAIEPFINDRMSPESREQINGILKGAWDQILYYTAEKTKLEKDVLNNYADDMSVIYAKSALEKGFVNSLASMEEVEDKMMQMTETKKKPVFANWRTYYRLAIKEKEVKKDNKVALVFAGGEINSESSDGESISSDDLSKLLGEIRRDEEIKAVVIRVNSPGGSALASDVIWTSTQWLKDAKPIVTSFGNVAASGGYYMAAGSQYIFAEKSSITGSIGVFGLSFATEKFWNDRIGMTFDTAKSHKFSDLESLVRRYSPEEFQKMQSVVDAIYEDFLNVVQTGRTTLKTRDKVHEIAQGRVWIGSDAKEIGLIDEFGGIEQAITKAAELAQLKDYSVEVFPKEKSALEEFVSQFGEISLKVAKAFLPETIIDLSNQLKKEKDDKILTRLPFNIEIR